MCIARMKILLGLCRAGGDGTRGCHPLLGGVTEACAPCPSLSWSWWLSQGESLDSMLDRHIDGVLDVVSLLGVLCVETWPGPFALLRCSPLSSVGPLRRYVRSSPVSPRRCFL